MRYPWPAVGPGRATSVRPTLQTSSNQHDLNRLARTSVTNVVNLSPKTSIFSEKADGLTTFVTTGQKSTRKTPWIDDVCNNTRCPVTPTGSGGARLRRPWATAGPVHASSRRTSTRQHTRSDWCGGRRRTREGLAAVPVGGGGAWPGFEATRPTAHQPRRPHWCEGRRRDRRARLRCPWAVAGPGRASRRRAERSSRRGRRAGGPPPTGTPSSPAHRTARAAPGTPAGPQAPPKSQNSS